MTEIAARPYLNPLKHMKHCTPPPPHIANAGTLMHVKLKPTQEDRGALGMLAEVLSVQLETRTAQ